MKKRLAYILTGALALSAFAGCGTQNAAPAAAATETNQETTEASVQAAEPETETEKPSAFEANLDSYESLILSAPVDAYYAFADLAEMSDAMIIAPGDLTFDNGDGTTAATGGTIYALGPDGNIMEYGYVEGGGTATPLATGEGYVLFYGGRDYMNKVTLDTDAGKLNIDEGEYFDEYEDAITLAFMPVATYGNSDEDCDGPSDFVQEQSGKLEFADYDEIISFLKPGQGYATIQIGDDGNVLAVAEEVNKEDHTATSASCYVMKDGKPVEVGYVIANQIPLRAADGVVYGGDEKNTYEANFLNPEGNGIMAKAYIYKTEENGKTEFGGFMRETNTFDQDQDFTGGEEEFDALIAERDKVPVIEFTIVE
ncbi:MAG: hypothetical protein IJJ13_10000 [Lachnospiraceae bacterium]|nr:hypothetical protein [Lachnospiraceae bacterium]